ncbi:glycosylase [Amycolatopsis albispora]|uniref:Glycosylase n=1 Tax=Amycolatopsis albispora TaxID=1804986 RepID=A0A344LK09_9PSEU|nr:glycosylase [Amycolatopsis albispora]
MGRRGFLRGAALATAVPLLPAWPAAHAHAKPVQAAGPALAEPFPLADVKLTDGLFAAKRALVLDHARGYDVDRLLQVFRANAGLPTLGAVAPGGWEGLDGEANGNLRGHYTGHFLTLLAQAHASTGEAVFTDRLRYMIGALTEVRDALRRDPVVLSTPGRFGRALEHVRGSYQYLDLPAGVLAGTTAVTLSAWVRPDHDASWTRVFDFGNDTTRYLFLATRTATGVPRFAITTGGPGQEQVVDGTAPLSPGTWSHLAVTLDGTAGTLYVNGVVAGRNPAMTLTPAALGPLAHHWIGRSHFPDPVFAGAFDQVDIFSRALSAAEIAHLQHTPSPGDLASYRLDETTGSTFADGSGRGLTATLRRTWGGPSHPGFLAAYPETQFITLESMTSGNYTVVWAPYYTAHKILRGLLDAYLTTKDTRALDLASGLCDWMHSRLAKLPKATLQRMWGIFSSGEFGGIVEAICDVHAHTGKPEHLALARLFDLDHLIDSCAAGTDVLTGLHANQHIPIFTGLLRLHDATGEQRYLDAARNFWPMVVPPRMYSIGGTSTGEFWREPGAIASTLSEVNAETCCAHNLLKLTRALFRREPAPKYADYYERTLYNQILGSKQDTPDPEKPRVTYFIGLAPGHVRDYTPKQGTTCCEGTGLESATKYQDSVYFRGDGDSALYVNLYSPSTLTWTAKGVTITQRTAFPVEQGTRLTIGGTAQFTLRLRVPAWCLDGFEVRVNNTVVTQPAVPGSYFDLTRTWQHGDTISVRLPFRFRTEATPDNPAVQSLFYGPVNLVARDPRKTFLRFSFHGKAALDGDLSDAFTPIPGKPLHFLAEGIEFAPFHEGTEDPAHVYFERHEPAIVFGGLDSGVANPVRANGFTLLDDLWSHAPFRSKADFVARVRSAARTWQLSAEDTAGVLATARAAY